MPMGLGYGAAQGLEQVLARQFQKALEAQRIKEQAKSFALQQRGQDLSRLGAEELHERGMGQLGVSQKNADVAQGGLDLRTRQQDFTENVDVPLRITGIMQDRSESEADRASRERIAQINQQGSLTPLVINTGAGPQILDRRAGTTSPITDSSGETIGPAPTADMRNAAQRRGMAERSVQAVKDLSERVITLNGVAQRAQAAGQSVEAALGENPLFRTYQDSRVALAGNLAVLQQGSRPSDADIKAVWLPLVPDVFRDTAESRQMKWDLIHVMSGFDTGASDMGGTETPDAAPANVQDNDPLGILGP